MCIFWPKKYLVKYFTVPFPTQKHTNKNIQPQSPPKFELYDFRTVVKLKNLFDSDLVMEERSIPVEETPSREELLTMVKKHSKLLMQTKDDDQEASTDVEMDAQFWQEMLDLYFICYRISRGHQDDDLVFFVRNMSLHGYGFNDNMEGEPPFFVRRWSPKLEKVFGGNPLTVDWRRSYYLNLIAHTSYTVTVAICSIQALHRHQRGDDTSLTPVYKVVKTVYASPSRVNFQLDHKKAVETSPAYPNICFAVDDFDDTFDAVILSERDHCFCVLLNAHGGAAFPKNNNDTDTSHSRRPDCDSDRVNISKLTLFSGFVSYQMVREAYDAGKSGFGNLFSSVNVSSKADRLYMRGPGGRGEVEVAVSGIADQSLQDYGPYSPILMSKRGTGIDLGTIVHRASALAKNAYNAATSSTNKNDTQLLPLKCCLMSISLPWEYIAHDLLFKETPPVNI